MIVAPPGAVPNQSRARPGTRENNMAANLSESKITFIGGGNMASALIAGLAGKITGEGGIHVIDPNQAALDKLREQYGVSTAKVIDAEVAASHVIVLAVKPQSMREVGKALASALAAAPGAAPLIVSIAAGIRTADLSRWLGGYQAIVRCMPNTPALIGLGITGLYAGPGVGVAAKEIAGTVLQAVGQTLWVEQESQIDAVTAVSGSGPAYAFYLIEAMQQAASELGLSAEQGSQLALATLTGAAQLAVQSSEPVQLLRERVTSKGGTTYAAITSMEQSGVKGAIVTAIKAAAHRAHEMGEELGKD
jgi:pyrroline-5-carboxylate reductase